MSSLSQRPAGPCNGQRVQRVTDHVPHNGAWHGASEKDSYIDRLAHGAHLLAWQTGSDEALAQIVQIGPPERLGQLRIAPSVRGQVVMFRDDDRELIGPGTASSALQPGVHGADRGPEIVQRAEHIDVVKGGGDGQLVVAVIVVRHDHTGQVSTR